MRTLILSVFLMLVLGVASPYAQTESTAGNESHAPSASENSESAGTATEAEDSSAQTLIRILENEQARNELIEQLQSVAAEPSSPAEGETAVEETAPDETVGASSPTAQDDEAGLPKLIAEYTQSVAVQSLELLTTFGDMGKSISETISGSDEIDLTHLSHTAFWLLMAIAVVFISFFVLRRIASVIVGRFAQQAEGRGWQSRLVLLVPTALIDGATIVIAWGTGYVFSLFFGTQGEMSIYQTLFLNAFLFIEASKLIVRLVFMQKHQSLRFLPLSDTDSNYWYFWISRVISLVGYGLLFAVPVINTEISLLFGDLVKAVIVFIAIVIGILIVLQNKTQVRNLLNRRVRKTGNADALGKFLTFLGNHWHQIAVLYLIAFFIVWLSNAERALPFMLEATVRSIVAIIVGVVLIGVISRAIALILRLPAEVKRQLPLLEARLSAFVPTILRITRIVISIAVFLAIIDAWHLIAVADWILSAEGQGLLGTVLSVAIILLLGGIVYLAVTSWVEFRLNPEVGHAPTAREVTLLALLRNAFTILLITMLAMIVLSEVGVNIGPLIAGAGMFGLAISFGAQKMVQDIITGAFIQFENAMNAGDVVTVGGISGVVEKLSIRSVSIRSLDGTLHLISFASVDMVSNYMRHFSYHVAEIGVAYRESIPEVKQAMQDAFDRLWNSEEHSSAILEPLEMHGVVEFADSSVVVRARIKTVPGSQWAVGRAFNELVKEVFDERGIEIPYPHLTLYMGEDKKGMAPPMRILNESSTGNEESRNHQTKVEDKTDDTGEGGEDEQWLAKQREGKISSTNQDGPATDES